MRFLLIIISILIASEAHAIAVDVEIPHSVDPQEYVQDLVTQYPLPAGLAVEVSDGKLIILGDGYLSESWEGKTQAAGDLQTEQNAMVLGLGALAALGGSYVYLKNEETTA